MQPVDQLEPGFLLEHARRLTSGTGRPYTAERAIRSIFQAIGGAQADLLEIMDLLRSLKVEREIADYDRTRPVYRSSVQDLVAQASTVVSLLGSDRQADTDTRVFLGLVALRS